MSGSGLRVFVICPLEGCIGSFVFTSGVATFSQHNIFMHFRLNDPNSETCKINIKSFFFYCSLPLPFMHFN